MERIDRHTRVVGWLKLALPLAALVILSTLFLVADRIDPEDALPYAKVDVEGLARAPRMTAPERRCPHRARSPKTINETTTPRGILRSFITASTPVLTLRAPTFHRKNPSPEATTPR